MIKNLTPRIAPIQFIVAFVVCLAIRLIPPPFRAPNVEPIMATMMPFARQYGVFVGFIFAFLSMVALDLVVGRVGIWTLVTALTYGMLGALAPTFLQRFSGRRGYVSYAIVATLVFDGITGVAMGPLFFGQSFAVAFVGQIPFTIMHVLGNVVFALTLSPFIEAWLAASTKPSLATAPQRPLCVS